MKKIFTLTLLLVSFSCSLWAQTTFKRNAVFLEAGGNGIFGSIGYERQLTKEPGLGFRFGIGFWSENGFYMSIPVGFNYLFPLKKQGSFIEGGAGITWSRRDGRLFKTIPEDDKKTHFFPSIGYRRHTKGNTMWRINISPAIHNNGFVPWVGLSIGKLF